MLYKYYQQHIFPHVLNQVMQVPSLMDKRRELLLPIQGEVLEIGFGTGLNLPFYQNVDTVFALEPSPEIYHLALERVQAAAFEVHHVQARAEKLPFADQSLEHVVSTWTLCSIAELEQAGAFDNIKVKPEQEIDTEATHQKPAFWRENRSQLIAAVLIILAFAGIRKHGRLL